MIILERIIWDYRSSFFSGGFYHLHQQLVRDHCYGHINALLICELSIGQLISFLVVEPVHQGLSSRIGIGARIILDLF